MREAGAAGDRFDFAQGTFFASVDNGYAHDDHPY
jgi:hypothetical protein